MRNRDCSFSSFPSSFSAKWSDSPSIIIHPTTDYPASTAAYHPVQFIHLVPLFLRQGMSHVLRYQLLATRPSLLASSITLYRLITSGTWIESQPSSRKCKMQHAENGNVRDRQAVQSCLVLYFLSICPSILDLLGCWEVQHGVSRFLSLLQDLLSTFDSRFRLLVNFSSSSQDSVVNSTVCVQRMCTCRVLQVTLNSKHGILPQKHMEYAVSVSVPRYHRGIIEQCTPYSPLFNRFTKEIG